MTRTLAITIASCLTLLPAAAQAVPRQGTTELRLGPSGPGPVGFTIASGAYRWEDDNGGFTMIGIEGGFGRFLADIVEIGVTAVVESFSFADNDETIMGISPFLKILVVPVRIGFYAEIDPEILLVTNDGPTFFGVRLGAGIEGFVTNTWSIHAGPMYAFRSSSEGDLHLFGINWGIATYF